MKAVSHWIKENRHQNLRDVIEQVNMKLRGYYSYYGITFNSRGISRFYYVIERELFKWMNRRGGKRINWETFGSLVTHHYPLLRPYIVHSYL